MWLTKVLLGKQPLPRRFFSGKFRIPFRITQRVRRELLRDLAIEEENLFYLRQPYLNQGQQEAMELCYAGKGKASLEDEKLRHRWSKMKRDVYLEDRLDHLRSSDAWE